MLTEEEKARNREAYRNKTRKQQKKVWLILGGVFFLLFFGRTIWGTIGINIPYSEGERKVQIVKITSRGLLWKTWEIEGIMAPGHGIATTYVWDFSIDNINPAKNELLQKLNDAYAGGRTVNIRYKQMAGCVPWRSKTTYFAKEIIIMQ